MLPAPLEKGIKYEEKLLIKTDFIAILPFAAGDEFLLEIVEFFFKGLLSRDS